MTDYLLDQFAALAKMAREVSQWINQGKTSFDLALLICLSENTVKHDITKFIERIAGDNYKNGEALKCHIQICSIRAWDGEWRVAA